FLTGYCVATFDPRVCSLPVVVYLLNIHASPSHHRLHASRAASQESALAEVAFHG
ncbi:unnamed protein product, partial [Ascophyllum nodosum]